MLARGQQRRALSVKRSGPASIATGNVADGHRAVRSGEESHKISHEGVARVLRAAET